MCRFDVSSSKCSKGKTAQIVVVTEGRVKYVTAMAELKNPTRLFLFFTLANTSKPQMEMIIKVVINRKS